jgi:hypothetical protein
MPPCRPSRTTGTSTQSLARPGRLRHWGRLRSSFLNNPGTMDPLPAALPGTAVRVLATTDLAGVLVPFQDQLRGGGSCAGAVELLEAERERQPTVWMDAGDLTVGPTYPLLGRRAWAERWVSCRSTPRRPGPTSSTTGCRRCWRRPGCCRTRCCARTSTWACRPPRWSTRAPVPSA